MVSLSLHSQTLDDYLIIAAENNPGLKAAYARYEATLERTKQPGLPDPELQVGFFFKPMERYMGNQQADIQLMQMFPWFGTIGTQKEEANQMALAQYQLFLEEKNQLMYLVKSTWYEMIRLNKEISIVRENLEFLQKHEELALIRYQVASGGSAGSASSGSAGMPSAKSSSAASGMNGMDDGAAKPSSTGTNPGMSSSSMGGSSSTMSDILQLRIEKKGLENTLAQLEADLEPQQIKFNKLLNREIREGIALTKVFSPIQLEADKLILLDSIKANNPMLAMLDAEMTAYEQQAKMARQDGRPMLGAGVNYMPFTARQESGMSMGGQDMVMPMVSMTLPIYRKKVNARIKEAELLRDATMLDRQKTENLLAMEWANAFRDWEDANRKLALYSEQIELTEQNLELLATSYTAGQVGMEKVLDAHHQLHTFQLSRINAINKQYQSLLMLEKLTASTLPIDQDTL
ncbi:TolC family protein [Algoriphagus jejuensis]|uniref:TolC family protein n=1 Tax=Algoriphagus jejuensis TaxID=419934 RepID=A0ABN1MYB4_9BACT